jgi:H+/gluconate symporter-like permease
MTSTSRRDWALTIFGAIFAAGLFIEIGPTYLNPLPMWLKLVLIVAGSCVIAGVAIYSRRRARRTTTPR